MNRQSIKPVGMTLLIVILAGAIPVFGQVRGYDSIKNSRWSAGS